MMRGKRFLRRAGVAALGASVYPIWIIGYTWSHVLSSDLGGGRHGPLDAYRHALASAAVSYTLGEWAVTLVTRVFESGGKDSNAMDSHNNQVGARIGSRVASFAEIEPAVREAVRRGRADAVDDVQITWMTPKKWRSGAFW